MDSDVDVEFSLGSLSNDGDDGNENVILKQPQVAQALRSMLIDIGYT